MCGIVGIASRHGTVNTAQLSLMRDSLFHRGPDAAGMIPGI
jgi:asparagine synthetase B (glutamine-hydrolysing)